MSDQPTPWVPTRYQVPSSRVIWQRGVFRLHHSALQLIVVSVVFLAFPLVAGRVVDPALADPRYVAVAFAFVWAFTISFLHHELAHALMARRFGIRTLAMGFHGNGAYVRFRKSDSGTTPRAWMWILAAGPLSNATVGTVLLGLWATGAAPSGAASLFCGLAGTVEIVWALATGVPRGDNDGRAILDARSVTLAAEFA